MFEIYKLSTITEFATKNGKVKSECLRLECDNVQPPTPQAHVDLVDVEISESMGINDFMNEQIDL